MKQWYNVIIALVLVSLTSCSQKAIAYTNHSSASGTYRIDIPNDWGFPRKIGNLMQIVSSNDDEPVVVVDMVSYSSLSAYLNSGEANMPQGTRRHFDYNLKEQSENLVAYKITTPTTMMFSACSIFGFKELDSGYYVVNVMKTFGDWEHYKQIVQHMLDSIQDSY